MSNGKSDRGSASIGMASGVNSANGKSIHLGTDINGMGKVLTKYCLGNSHLATSGLHVIFSGATKWKMEKRPTMAEARIVAKEYDVDEPEPELEEKEKEKEKEKDSEEKKKEIKKKKAERKAAKEVEIEAAAKIIHEQLTKDWIKKYAKHQEEAKLLYAYIVTNCSESLLQLMKANDDWDVIDTDENPELLWKLIQVTCLNGAVLDSTTAITKARRNYEDLKQRQGEWLADYRKRFLQQVEHLNNLTNDSYEEEEYTAKYVQSLNTKFNKFKEVYNGQVAFDENLRYTNFEYAHSNILKVEAKIRENSGENFIKDKQSPEGVMFVGKKNCVKCLGKGHTAKVCPTADKNLKSKIKCNKCGGVGHKATECNPDGKNFIGIVGKTLVGKMVPAGKRIILDDASDFSIIKDHTMLSNIRKCKEVIIGGHVKGANLKVGMEGLLFGEIYVLYSEEVEENILSKNAMKELGYKLFGVENWGVRMITKTNGCLDFLRIGNHLVLDWNKRVQVISEKFTELFNDSQEVIAREYKEYTSGLCLYQKSRPVQSYGVETVKENESKYTKRQIENAKLAIEFIRNSGFKSPDELMKRISVIKDMPLVGQDIARALDVYGYPEDYLKGKMKNSKSKAVVTEFMPRITTKRQIGHVDNFWVAGQGFVLMVIKPLHMVFTFPLTTKHAASKDEMVMAITRFKKLLLSKDLVLDVVICDREFMCVDGEIEGLKVELVTTDGHVPVAERMIQVIKESARGCMASLPYVMCEKFVRNLVQYCVYRENASITSTNGDNISPRTKFSGIKDNWKEYTLHHQSLVMLKEKSKFENNMNERSFEAIAMYPIGNISGDWCFRRKSNMSYVYRSKWWSIPMNEDHVKFMGNLAEREGAVTTSEKVRERKHNIKDNSATEEKLLDEVPIVPKPLGTDDGVDSGDGGNKIFIEESTSNVNDIVEIEGVGTDDNPCDDLPEKVVADNVDNPCDDLPEQVVVDNIDVSDDENVMKLDSRVEKIIGNDDKLGEVMRRVHRSGKAYVGIISKSVLVGKNKTTISQKKAIKMFHTEAKDTMFEELYTLYKNGTAHPVDIKSLTSSQLKKVIRSFMFITEKKDADGRHIKLKARLVAMGNQQHKGELIGDVSSPTISTANMYTVVAIASAERRSVLTADVTAAFVKAKVPAGVEILVKLDKINAQILCQIQEKYKKYLDEDGTMIVKLDKALYGCVQSCRLWYELLRSTLEEDGFTRNPYEWCCFNKHNKNGHQVTIMFHVDDIFASCVDLDSLDDVEKMLVRAFKDVKVMRGKEHHYLGRKIIFRENDVIITMAGLVEKIIDESGILENNNNKVCTTPAALHLHNIREDCPKLCEVKRKKFHSLVQTILYLAVQLRRDLLPAVSFLTSRVAVADEDDWKKLVKVVVYLNSTKHIGLRFSGSGLERRLSIDAAFGVHHNRRSQSGMARLLGENNVVSAKSSMQKLVTKSSTEAELVAASDFASGGLDFNNFMMAQGYQVEPVMIEQDNKSCITMLEKGRSTNDLTKHIGIRYFFLKDRIDSNELRLQYIPTEELLADVMTKPLQGSLFVKLRNRLQNWYGIDGAE
jgi:hypothetical protein